MSDAARVPKYTREEPDVRRSALIAATARCLAEHGAAGTSVRVVAARAGVSAGLIRFYFGTMENLIVETYRAVGERVSRATEEAVDAAGADPADRLDAFLTANFRPPILDGELMGTWLAFWSLVRTTDTVRAVKAEIYADVRARLEALIAAVADARGRRIDVRRVATGIAALVDGLWLELCLDPTAVSAEDAIAFTREAVANAIG